jgi:hypothetical protein
MKNHFVITIAVTLILGTTAFAQQAAVPASPNKMDFRFSPPEWQTSICLPDDPHKTLVDRSGELLYHYGKGGREFGTRIGVQISDAAVWTGQELYSPRVPIVRTHLKAEGLVITEEAFAITDYQPSKPLTSILKRTDNGSVNTNWAKPQANIDPSLRDIAVNMGGNIHFEVIVKPGASCRIAMALCEGYWREAGKRIQVLSVEGAESKTVDLVAEIGQNKAAAFWFDGQDKNSDGKILISVEAAPTASDKNTVLNGLWVFDLKTKTDNEALLAGRLTLRALADLHLAISDGPVRSDLMLVSVKNQGTVAHTFQPRLNINTTMPLTFQAEKQRAVISNHEIVTSSLKLIRLGGETDAQRFIELESLTIPAGQTIEFFIQYYNGSPSQTATLAGPVTLKQAFESRTKAVEFWETKSKLPFDRVQLPDAGIQSLVESSIRNIWQAREIKNGLPAFQVGPTCYRGLWIVDGAFLLESAAMVGAGDQARNGVAYELTVQKPDGRIEVLTSDFWKENGIVLWTCVRHAQLTQDKAWLELQWPKLRLIAEYIKTLRKQTLNNSSLLDNGLNPAGTLDGGIGGTHDEYTNSYWNLTGLHAFIQAARWLGKTEEATAWQKEYDDFMQAFLTAAKRDMSKDPGGNEYLPILMGDAGKKELPQRAQWAFCHAVYPGQIFPRNDALVAGNLAMLEATEREGMVYGTGWDATGIWNYFASFYGHAWLWQGNGLKAAQSLFAMGNHASPTLVWREEQSLKGERFKKVGDMPHNWASAEFIRLAIHLIALDRGDELHLFEGLPAEWTKAGMVTKLNGIATPFGSLSMSLNIAADGKSAKLDVQPLSDPSCKNIVVHLEGWTQQTDKKEIRLDPRKHNEISIPIATEKTGSPDGSKQKWTNEKANSWYKEKGWQSGCNYIPATAINSVEMWQKESFDPSTIDKELGWAEELGFNTMRVFLNSLVWKSDPDGFKKRVAEYLAISAKHKITAAFVFFDDCWNEESKLGKQPDPKPGVHNSGWVQDPSRSLRKDTAKLYQDLEKYVKDIIGTFKNDDRVLFWDMFNEPGPGSIELLTNAYQWAREISPSQPVTSGLNNLNHIDINRYRLENSDIITFHCYDSIPDQSYWIKFLKLYDRPVICTEYMARTIGCRFADIMPLFKQNNVGAINWGFVSGKTNTIYAWDDPRPDGKEPPVWFHDILRKDKTPYDPKEIVIIKETNGRK